MALTEAQQKIVEYNRSKTTKFEKRFEELLNQHKIMYQREYVIELWESFMMVDFYLPKTKVVIELDGRGHLGRYYCIRDKLRDKILTGMGLKVYRIRNDDIENFNFNQIKKEKRKKIRIKKYTQGVKEPIK